MDHQNEIEKIFSSAYLTKTFKRTSFTNDDRTESWFYQADRELRMNFFNELKEKYPNNIHDIYSILEIWDNEDDLDNFLIRIENSTLLDDVKKHIRTYIESVDFESISDNVVEIAKMNIKGINLRHVIPYSDIAGIMRMAFSKYVLINKPDYYNVVHEAIDKLIELIGRDYYRGEKSEMKVIWQKYNKKTIDLSNPNVRSEIRSLFLWLSHSPANLFHGNGGVNQAIGNCFDYSELYGNIEDLDKIYNFWNTLFTDLNFQPQEVNKIYCILLDKYIPASYLWDNHHCKFFQHKLTRSIKGAKGIIE